MLRDAKINYGGYEDTAYGYDKDYGYDFLSVGVSTFLYSGKNFAVSVDIDYVVPYNITGSTKSYVYINQSTSNYLRDHNETLISETNILINPFVNLAFNFDFIFADDIVLGSGITISSEDVWKYYSLTFRLGVKF